MSNTPLHIRSPVGGDTYRPYTHTHTLLGEGYAQTHEKEANLGNYVGAGLLESYKGKAVFAV